MKYEILDDEGNVINTIIAEQSFIDENYPTNRLVEEDVIAPEPIKEQPPIAILVADCQALLAKLIALQGA